MTLSAVCKALDIIVQGGQGVALGSGMKQKAKNALQHDELILGPCMPSAQGLGSQPAVHEIH